MTIKRLYPFLLLCGSLHAADWSLLRRAAQVAACAATAADAATTLRPGLRETNPLLGQGASVIGIKLGVCAGQIAFAEWRSRRHPEIEKPATFAAFGEAGVFTVLAIRNSRIKP